MGMVTINEQINVLIACEESQAECLAFRQLGFNAFSCDIQKCRYRPDWHILGDVTQLLRGKTEFYTQDKKYHSVSRWHLIIAHPPCTYLCKVSAIHLRKKGEIQLDRLEKLYKARTFFFECLNAKAEFVAVENPLPLGLANLPKSSCFIQPSWYGVKYTKKTLYWLRNLPPLMPAYIYPNPKCYTECSSGKYRSRTFPEIATAIANQWGNYIINNINKMNYE